MLNIKTRRTYRSIIPVLATLFPTVKRKKSLETQRKSWLKAKQSSLTHSRDSVFLDVLALYKIHVEITIHFFFPNKNELLSIISNLAILLRWFHALQTINRCIDRASNFSCVAFSDFDREWQERRPTKIPNSSRKIFSCSVAKRQEGRKLG